jgi:hypothetical protein
MIMPAITARIEEWGKTPRARIQRLNSITFQQITPATSKGKIEWCSGAASTTRNDVFDFEEGVTNQFLITPTVLASTVGTHFHKITPFACLACHRTLTGLGSCCF